MTDKYIVFVTVPDSQTGEKIANAVVGEQLVACVNILPQISSIYTWQGKIEKSSEALLIMKTRKELFEKLHNRILALHPYEVPEIIAFPIENGFIKYLQWIDDCVKPNLSK